jgi:hypothetical protein
MSARIFAFLVSAAGFLLLAPLVQAGFGITPPYVVNSELGPGSSYEQKIVVSRNDPIEDLRADITVNVPGADQWISIDKGASFILPRGSVQVPMFVRVRVPDDAKFGDYNGNIRIVLSSAGGPAPGTIGISLGAQIDVKLSVVDRKTYSFAVPAIRMPDLEEGHAWWKYYFPGMIRFAMQVENTGNMSYGPTRVALTVRDVSGVHVLESTENLGAIRTIGPFSTEWVTAEIPTRLAYGAYRATFAIYNRDSIVRQGDLSLSIQPFGSIPDYRGGFGFLGLRRREQVEIVLGFLLLVAAVYLAAIGIRRAIRRRHA